MHLYNEPFDNMPMLEPERPPRADEVLLGYELVNKQGQIFSRPHPTRMNTNSWLMTALLAILFWPLTCVPCFCSNSYDVSQRPVYGKKYRDVNNNKKHLKRKKRCHKRRKNHAKSII